MPSFGRCECAQFALHNNAVRATIKSVVVVVYIFCPRYIVLVKAALDCSAVHFIFFPSGILFAIVGYLCSHSWNHKQLENGLGLRRNDDSNQSCCFLVPHN